MNFLLLEAQTHYDAESGFGFVELLSCIDFRELICALGCNTESPATLPLLQHHKQNSQYLLSLN